MRVMGLRRGGVKKIEQRIFLRLGVFETEIFRNFGVALIEEKMGEEIALSASKTLVVEAL